MTSILIINGHPDPESLCSSVADAYEKAAQEAEVIIERLNLGELSFDPILHHGYRKAQELEPDLQKAQELILRCEHLVLVFPIWWGTVPALLKGFFDRVLLPGYAFKYEEGQVLPQKLLKGRSARIITTMDTPPWYYRLVLGAKGTKAIERQVLKFCGFKVKRTKMFGPIRGTSLNTRKKWLQQTAEMGQRGL